ncbi:MAG: hypothetical protein HKP61_07460 [Dactylosporangium sp.]|nr:hypothetical protein [Dactylosporangium sp.]NNJ60777.1 hypothetical protein [Dactylosporangium sp.]
MSNNLWFDARQVVAGTADLKASGQAIGDAISELDGATAPVSALDAGHPAGTDATGQEFEQWYATFKAHIIAQGKELGEIVTELGTSAELALAQFVKTDLESAADLRKLT